MHHTALVLEASRRIYDNAFGRCGGLSYRGASEEDNKIDVGGIPPQEVEQYMQSYDADEASQVVGQQRSCRQDTTLCHRGNYIPVWGGQSNTDISNLPSSSYNGGIDDVKYLRDKLFASQGSQSYLTMGEGASTDDKGTLARKTLGLQDPTKTAKSCCCRT